MWIVLWDPFLMKNLLKSKFCGFMNSAHYALFTGKVKYFRLKKKKTKETQNVHLGSANALPKRTLSACLDWAFAASAFNLHVSFLFFIFLFFLFFVFTRFGVMRLLFMNYSLNSSSKGWIFYSKQCICALFTDPQIPLFSNFFIKNGSHSTIHTFKNYFAIVFSVFSFGKISSI